MVENVIGILEIRFRVLLGTMEQYLKVVRDMVLTCVVLQTTLRTGQAKDVTALQNKQVVYVTY